MVLLPDSIDLLDEDGRTGVVRLMIIIAAADGELLREEIVCIEAQMGRAMLPPQVRQELRQLISNPPTLEEELLLHSSDVLKIGLRDGMLLASADGVYHSTEVKMIEQIASAAGITASELSELYDWVHDGWKWMARGRSHMSVTISGDSDLLKEK